ncbi:MAG: LuxR C-terminal-related transcriptional regulator, partial [Gaiella sp.]
SAKGVDPTTVGLGVVGLLRALSVRSPMLVAVDDLQWLDAPTLRAVTFAYRRLDEEPVGLLAALRAGFAGELTEIAARGGRALRRVEIGGLGARELAALVHERTGRALAPSELRRVTDLSAGNPYYALELAATARDDLAVPESLAAALRTRLLTLSPTARAAGLTAALLGRFEGADPRALDELRASRVIDVHPDVPHFAHPLLASTLVDLSSSDERRAVHLALATSLADRDERALHLARGTVEADDAVAEELEHAAFRLDARGAPESAAWLVERAADLTPASDAAAKTRRLLAAADLHTAAGEGRGRVLPLLERLVQTLPAGANRARALVRLGWLGAQVDTMTASESIAFERRALEEEGDAPDVRVAANAALARLLGNAGDYTAAHHHAQAAVEAGEPTEANSMFPSPAGELGTAMFFAGRGFHEQLFEPGIATEAALPRSGEPYQSSSLQLALALLYTGQLSRARAVLEDLLRLSEDLGRIRSAAGCLLHLVELEVRAGALARAEAHAAEFVHLDRQLRGELSGEWYPSALVSVHLGRSEDARRILTKGIEDARAIESTIWLAHQFWALGHLELALGDLDAAREALVPLPAMLRETGLGEWAVHPVHPDAIETLVELGELEEAAGLTAELEAYGRRLDRPWGLATAARSAALIASARGELEAALEATDRALTEHERLDWPFEHARTLLVRGGVLRRIGRRRDAGAVLAEAKAAFATLRNPLWHDRVEAEERRLGGRQRATGALTPTEKQVAELAGEGLRNAEIAARLFVTPKTVEATLSRVYRKLGVRSRTELARQLQAD